jgi:hypothetical protein
MRFKNKQYTKSGVIRRLLHYYRKANTDDLLNVNWYKDANEFCKQLSEDFDVPLFKVVGVCSAMSPQKNWQENKKLTFHFLRGKRGGHYPNQVEKAQACITANDAEEIFNMLTIGGKKTSWFFYNILYPDIPTGVTIDRHAIGACVFSPKEIKALPDEYSNISINQYKFFAECFVLSARIVGVLPHEFQAIVWSVYRRLRELPPVYEVEPF